PFVGSFVGTLNMLKARVIDAASGRLEVDGQEIRAARALGGAQPGAPLSVGLRPEIISLNGASATANHLRGTIEDIMFLGSIVRIRVRFKDSSIYFDMFNTPHLALPQTGQVVTVSFPHEACLILGDGG